MNDIICYSIHKLYQILHMELQGGMIVSFQHKYGCEQC